MSPLPRRHRLGASIAALSGCVLTIAAFYPGYMSADSIGQLREAREGNYTDLHPPLMALVWRGLDHVLPGPLGMLVFHNLTFWLGLRWIVGVTVPPERRVWPAVLVLAIGLWPASFALLGTIWKDIGMASGLLLGYAAVVHAATFRARWPLFIAVPAFFYAVSARHNAMVAVLPLLLHWGHAAHLAHFPRACAQASRARRTTIAVVLGLSVFGGLVFGGGSTNRALSSQEWYAGQQILLHDLVALSVARNEVLLPERLRDGPEPWTVEELRAIYAPSVIPMYWGPDRTLPLLPEKRWVDELSTLWREHVPANPAAYLSHRWRIFKLQMGLTSGRMALPFHPGIDDNPWHIEVAETWCNRAAMGLLHAVAQWPFFRGWIYLLVLLVITGLALRMSARRRATVLTISCSGLGYLVLGLFVSPVADFRYNHWGVLAALLGVAFACFLRDDPSQATANPG